MGSFPCSGAKRAIQNAPLPSYLASDETTVGSPDPSSSPVLRTSREPPEAAMPTPTLGCMIVSHSGKVLLTIWDDCTGDYLLCQVETPAITGGSPRSNALRACRSDPETNHTKQTPFEVSVSVFGR